MDFCQVEFVRKQGLQDGILVVIEVVEQDAEEIARELAAVAFCRKVVERMDVARTPHGIQRVERLGGGAADLRESVGKDLRRGGLNAGSVRHHDEGEDLRKGQLVPCHAEFEVDELGGGCLFDIFHKVGILVAVGISVGVEVVGNFVDDIAEQLVEPHRGGQGYAFDGAHGDEVVDDALHQLSVDVLGDVLVVIGIGGVSAVHAPEVLKDVQGRGELFSALFVFEVIAHDGHIAAGGGVAHRGARLDVIERPARRIVIVSNIAGMHVPGDAVAHAHLQKFLRDVLPIVEDEVFQDVILLLEVGEDVEVVGAHIGLVGAVRGNVSHPIKERLGESAAREMVVGGVDVDGVSRDECGVDLCRGSGSGRDAAVLVFEIEGGKVDGVVILKLVRRIIFCGRPRQRLDDSLVFCLAHAHGRDAFHDLAVGAVQYEEAVVGTFDGGVVAQCIDVLTAEKSSVILHAEPVFGDVREMSVEVADGDVVRVIRGNISVRIIGAPILFGIDRA